MAKRRGRTGNFKWLSKTLSGFFWMVLKILPAGLLIGCILFVFFGIKQMLYADPVFYVTRVVVFPSGVLSATEYEYLEREVEGKSLLGVNLKQVSKNLERNPKVKRAEVMRLLPNQLKVLLVTRSPVIQIRFSPKAPYLLVGSDRMILSSRQAADPNLIILEDFTAKKKSYTIGSLYQNNSFDQISEVTEWIKSDPILKREVISKVTIDQLGNIGIILSDGVELKIGREPVATIDKQSLLNSLLNGAERGELLYIDFRYSDVIVKKKI
jgi:cell division septal protein FtsQ